MHIVLWALLFLVGFYVLGTAGIYAVQRRLIYFPDPTYERPADADLEGVQEVRLKTPDGETLVAWYTLASGGRPTLLYFHGNAGTLGSRAPRIERFADAGLGVFMLAYRGYSGSTGTPSEAALVADANVAYDYLRSHGLQPHDIVPYGESLGTGVAVQLAAGRSVGALILDAPYTSVPDVGEQLYPFLPVQTLTIDRYESKRYIGQVKAPILIMHGTEDTTIPIEFAHRLFRLAPEPKEMAVLKGAGHSDIYSFGAMDRLESFLRRHLPKNGKRGSAGSGVADHTAGTR